MVLVSLATFCQSIGFLVFGPLFSLSLFAIGSSRHALLLPMSPWSDDRFRFSGRAGCKVCMAPGFRSPLVESSKRQLRAFGPPSYSGRLVCCPSGRPYIISAASPMRSGFVLPMAEICSIGYSRFRAVGDSSYRFLDICFEGPSMITPLVARQMSC